MAFGRNAAIAASRIEVPVCNYYKLTNCLNLYANNQHTNKKR